MRTCKKTTKSLLRPSGTNSKGWGGVCGGNKRHTLMRHREINGDLVPFAVLRRETDSGT